MIFFSRINSKLKGFLQDKTAANRTLFQCMLENDYAVKNARKAILALNGIRIQALSNGHISSITMYLTLNGQRANPTAKKILAESVGLAVDEFFPKENGRAAAP